jgi:hypothetical protein
VAQSGSAPEWGSGGRWFKSSRPDQKKIKAPGHEGQVLFFDRKQARTKTDLLLFSCLPCRAVDCAKAGVFCLLLFTSFHYSNIPSFPFADFHDTFLPAIQQGLL